MTTSATVVKKLQVEPDHLPNNIDESPPDRQTANSQPLPRWPITGSPSHTTATPHRTANRNLLMLPASVSFSTIRSAFAVISSSSASATTFSIAASNKPITRGAWMAVKLTGRQERRDRTVSTTASKSSSCTPPGFRSPLPPHRSHNNGHVDHTDQSTVFVNNRCRHQTVSGTGILLPDPSLPDQAVISFLPISQQCRWAGLSRNQLLSHSNRRIIAASRL